MNDDLQQYRARLGEYLRLEGIEFDDRKREPKILCPSPSHADSDPSASVYHDRQRVHCHGCGGSWDVFDLAGLLHGHSDFKDQLKHVQRTMGEHVTDTPARTPKPRPAPSKPVTVPKENADSIFNQDTIQSLGDLMSDGKGAGEFDQAWAYRDEDGDVMMVDARFRKGDGKQVISMFWTGAHLAATNPPRLVYGRDELAARPDAPVLVVEGCKSAQAVKESLPGFVAVTWNGGGSNVDAPDWELLANRDVYIYPDDDQKPKLKKWEQAGLKAAATLAEILPQAKIVQPLTAARKIKKSGADIVEALQVMKPAALAKHILESRGISPKKKKKPLNPSAPPFDVLGLDDRDFTWIIGRHKRMHAVNLRSVKRNDWIAVAPVDWWENNVRNSEDKFNWDAVTDWFTERFGNDDFDRERIRGRGAWREADGRICYHDGRDTIGEPDESRIYVRKSQKDIGLADAPLGQDVIDAIRVAVHKMSFESDLDAVRLMAWTALAPFCGCLTWRPAILLTGPSGSGKSTIANMVIRPLAEPQAFTGGDSTAAGVRQRIREDAYPILIEESEASGKNEQKNRQDMMSLMRQSTTDDAPEVAKGTQDQKGLSFTMRSAWCFIGISPEVENVADSNRIFHISLSEPRNEWQPIQSVLRENLTPENCRGFRALVWEKLPEIIESAHAIAGHIQDVSHRDGRFALAESLLIAAYCVIWKGETVDAEKLSKLYGVMLTAQPLDDKRDETGEVIDRLLDETVNFEYTVGLEATSVTRRTVTLRRLAIWATHSLEKYTHHKNDPSGTTGAAEATLGMYGLRVVSVEGISGLAIAYNHPKIGRIIGRGEGYHKMLCRHPGLMEKGTMVRIGGTGRRAVIIGGLVDGIDEIGDEQHDALGEGAKKVGGY